MNIAVLGMGRMGQALAGRLLDGGQRVVIWNRTPGRAARLLEQGAEEAPTVAAAVKDAAIAFTSLADDAAVREVAFGTGGLEGALDAAALYADTSTVSPGLGAELAEAFPRYVALPILGAPAAVASGQAVYLAGGSGPALALLEPVLPVLSETIRSYPTPELALGAKLAVNLLLLGGVVALAESCAVGRAGGLSDEQLRDLLRDSPMLAPGLRGRFEGVLTGTQEAGWWTGALGAKDAGLAIELLDRAGRFAPVASVVRSLFLRLASMDHADIAEVSRLYDR